MTPNETQRLLALLRGETVGDECPTGRYIREVNEATFTCQPGCSTCHGTGRIRTEPEGEVEVAAAQLRREADHAHLRDGWGCPTCNRVWCDDGLSYDRGNRFTIPTCPTCGGLLLLKASFDVAFVERERDEALAREKDRIRQVDQLREAHTKVLARAEQAEANLEVAIKAGRGIERAKREIDAFEATDIGRALAEAHDEATRDIVEENNRLTRENAELRAWATLADKERNQFAKERDAFQAQLAAARAEQGDSDYWIARATAAERAEVSARRENAELEKDRDARRLMAQEEMKMRLAAEQDRDALKAHVVRLLAVVANYDTADPTLRETPSNLRDLVLVRREDVLTLIDAVLGHIPAPTLTKITEATRRLCEALGGKS